MPIIYTGAPDVHEALVSLARGGAPSDYASVDRPAEDLHAFAEIMAVASGGYVGLAREARVATSHGVFTDQHAKDRGLSRGAGEADGPLKERLRSTPRAITPDDLEAELAAVVAAAGGSFSAIIEVPHDEIAVVRSSGDPPGAMSFINIGDCRVGSRRGVVIAQVPAGLDVEDAALAMLKAKRAAGKSYFVEEVSEL